MAEHRGWGWHGRLAGRCRGGCTCPTNGMETTYQVKLDGTIAYTPLRAASRNLHGPTHQRPLDRRRMVAAQHLQTHMPQKNNRVTTTAVGKVLPLHPPPPHTHTYTPARSLTSPTGPCLPGWCGALLVALPLALVPIVQGCQHGAVSHRQPGSQQGPSSQARGGQPALGCTHAYPGLQAQVQTRTGNTGGQEGER